ncbi:MAG: aspartate aminotransferase family protein [Alphaproteobacteria bacterium]|nr:aspartate aminotransferase family protein [Alphaproteobacteria bacterium]
MTTFSPNDLSAVWLPFTANRQFKSEPRIIARGKGMFYYDPQGRELLDGLAGLWCSLAGHGHKSISAAIAKQADVLDFAPTFQFAHPKVIELAGRLAALAPKGLDHVFFCNSGSEAADTALKIALAYWRAKGESHRTRLIGRVRGYHGTNFGGMSVGGIASNRRAFGPMLGNVDHLPTTYDRTKQAFSKGDPDHGDHFADALEEMVALHGDTIAAVIVEPMAGSTGVLPPPKGYLQRLRQLCDKHGLLLIFDEVITMFGRMGTATAAERYNVTPDMITFAKGVTNGVIPMGGVIASKSIYDTFQQKNDWQVELFHGYTYSGHPVAAAAALATLDIYRDEGLFERGKQIEKWLEEAVHGLKGAPFVADIRNSGAAAAIDIEPAPGAPGKRGHEAIRRAFFDENIVLRVGGDTIALGPALIAEQSHIERLVAGIDRVLRQLT